MLAGDALKWSDPTTWPWFAYVWVAVVLTGAVKYAARWLQARQVANWPAAEGRVEFAEVSPAKEGFFTLDRRGTQFLAQFVYSYSAGEGRESGRFQRKFASERSAHEFVRDLKGKPIMVRYDPNRRWRSWLLETDLELLLRNRTPAKVPEAPIASFGWSVLLLRVFIGISTLGLSLSIWVHLEAFMGRRVAPEALLWLLHIGIFVVWAPAVLVARVIAGNLNRKDLWKAVLKNAPAWMRYMTYGFFGYAMINFWLSFSKTPSPTNAGKTPFEVWRGFSGHWMAFYSAALAILYSAANAKHVGLLCPNGHAVPTGAQFCGNCGCAVTAIQPRD